MNNMSPCTSEVRTHITRRSDPNAGKNVDDASKDHHPAIAIPPTFTFPTAPPAPDFAAFLFASPFPASPTAAAVAHPTVPPPSTTALRRAPPGNSPHVKVDPAREVLFGPMNWGVKWNCTPHDLIVSVSGTTPCAPHASRRVAARTMPPPPSSLRPTISPLGSSRHGTATPELVMRCALPAPCL
ncbi:hypothetical protein B0H13DRAFT_2310251 [Mycena leptocephala]|nr:hypothetical protein B0H13DRAFT_2310251 [Mycena leptocephala]